MLLAEKGNKRLIGESSEEHEVWEQSSGAAIPLEGRRKASEDGREGRVAAQGYTEGHGRPSRSPAPQGLCLRVPAFPWVSLAGAGSLPFEGENASPLQKGTSSDLGEKLVAEEKLPCCFSSPKITAVAAWVRPTFPQFRELVSIFTSVRITYNFTQNLFSNCIIINICGMYQRMVCTQNKSVY